MANKKPIQTASGEQLLTGGTPLSVSYTVEEENIEILSAHVKPDVSITEICTVTRVSVVGAAYAFVLDTETFNSEQTAYNYLPGEGKVFAKRGDVITLACTAANNTGTAVGQILYREDI